jgi:hypothetical protein
LILGVPEFRFRRLSNQKMKFKGLTIALLFGLVLMSGGCASVKPVAASYFKPSPADEMAHRPVCENGSADADDSGWEFLYWAIYETAELFASR